MLLGQYVDSIHRLSAAFVVQHFGIAEVNVLECALLLLLVQLRAFLHLNLLLACLI